MMATGPRTAFPFQAESRSEAAQTLFRRNPLATIAAAVAVREESIPLPKRVQLNSVAIRWQPCLCCVRVVRT